MRRLIIIVPLALLALAASPALEPGPEAKKATYQCGDGVDNDGDGFTDYADDPQCIARYDYSELPQCSDGLDNDDSGDADYPADVDGCKSPDDDLEADIPVTACTDGYDNDLDGRTDYPSDRGCSSEADSSEKGKKSPPA